MRLADVLFAFPIILLAIGVIAVLGSNTLSIVMAIAVVYSPIFARLLRAPTLVLPEFVNDFETPGFINLVCN